MAIWRMRIACWIPKATNTHSEYVILIAFPLQQCLRERASMLPYSELPAFLPLTCGHTRDSDAQTYTHINPLEHTAGCETAEPSMLCC
jgi:hypothetical protein